MATAKVLHPLFERAWPWQAAIAPLRVRETESGPASGGRGVERGEKREATVARPFSWERGIRAKPVVHFALYEKEQIIRDQNSPLAKFITPKLSQVFCMLKTSDLARDSQELFPNFVKRTNEIDI
jgi:hypothetical protein